jgi:hypothetical protein
MAFDFNAGCSLLARRDCLPRTLPWIVFTPSGLMLEKYLKLTNGHYFNDHFKVVEIIP